MAVDYLHRLLVLGAHKEIRRFRREIRRRHRRTIRRETWTEIVSFSFAALYEIAPAARRVEPEVPCDPYELSAWPIRRIGRSQAQSATSSRRETSRLRI